MASTNPWVDRNLAHMIYQLSSDNDSVELTKTKEELKRAREEIKDYELMICAYEEYLSEEPRAESPFHICRMCHHGVYEESWKKACFGSGHDVPCDEWCIQRRGIIPVKCEKCRKKVCGDTCIDKKNRCYWCRKIEK